MRGMEVLFFLILAICIDANLGYKILCLFPFNGKSHFRMFDTLCKGLAERGHRVDMISHFPTRKPIANYTDVIDLSGTRKDIPNSLTVDQALALQPAITYYIATKYGGDLCELLGHEKIQNFIKDLPNRTPYDLMITEHASWTKWHDTNSMPQECFRSPYLGSPSYSGFVQLLRAPLDIPYLGSPCYLGFGQLLRAPVAIAATTLEAPYVDYFMNSPLNSAYFPGALTESAVLQTFSDRLWNALINRKEIFLYNYYTQDQTGAMRKYLGQNLPDVRELERDVSLALINSHHSFHGTRSLAPAVVEVGGLHVQDDESELTPEINDWLESADHGLVYFTLGSLLNIESLPRITLLSLYASFANISPVKVLMRCANATKLPSDLPKNVMTSPWIPQIPVLKHRNTRIFITHGGLMGTQEAIYYGVPMIGIPVFADQMRNINIMVHKNMGILMRLKDIDEHSMDAALKSLLQDPKYRESARRMSELFRDRPMSGLDTAIYWIEYVIRNGPDSLRSPAASMAWWKFYCIDIIVFIITCAVLMIYTLIRMIQNVSKKFYKKNKSKLK